MKTTLKKIFVWKTTDGETFENQDDAYAHQNNIAFKKKIMLFVDTHFSAYNLETKEALLETLTDNLEEIIEAYQATRCL